MKFRTTWIPAVLLGILFVAAGAERAAAVGTAAGTTVNNRATVTFTGGAGPQTVESSPTGNSTPGVNQGTDTDFLVDQMVDLTVSEADGTYTLAMLNDLQAAVGFNVTNTGNASQDIAFLLDQTATDPFPPGPDDFDPTIAGSLFYVDDGDGVFEPATDDTLVTHLDAVAADATVFVWVTADMPGAPSVPGDTGGLVLIAEARIDDGAGTLGGVLTEDVDGDDPALVEVLFADGTSGDTAFDVANDARHSDTDAYQIEAELTVSKTSLIFTDPVRCTDQEDPLTCATQPLAIPGAYLEYTITIDNQSATPATTVVVTDSLAAMIAAGNIAYRSGAYINPTHGIRYRISGVAPFPAWTDVTDAVDPDIGEFAADTVTVRLPDIPNGQVAEVTFQVVLQ